MIRLNIHEAKTHLSRYLDRLAKGEVILLCKRNAPIAEIRGLPPERRDRRPIGLAKGKITILPGFDDPLPEEFLDAFGTKPE
jgi:antitoxin (DNA-binding transcriptional repressor) of toxin-antitoxin stability system